MNTQTQTKLGRPPKDQARTATMRVRVLPAAKEEFERVARQRNMDPADAHREALRMWMS